MFQTRFSIWPTAGDADGQWYVGLTYTDSLEKNFEDLTTVRWLKPKMTEMRVNNINASAKWWIFNLQSTGTVRFFVYGSRLKQRKHCCVLNAAPVFRYFLSAKQVHTI